MVDHTFLEDQGFTVESSGANWPDPSDATVNTIYFRSSDQRYAIAALEPAKGSNDVVLQPLMVSHGVVYGPLQQQLTTMPQIAISGVLPTTVSALETALDYSGWNLSDWATARGFAQDSTTPEILRCPVSLSTTVSRCTGLIAESTIQFSGGNLTQGQLFVPWGGFPQEDLAAVGGGAILGCRHSGDSSSHRYVQIQTTTPVDDPTRWQIQIYGAGAEALSSNTRVSLYAILS